MEKNIENFRFNNVVSFDTLGQEAINGMNLINNSIYGSEYGFTNENTKTLLNEVFKELDIAVDDVENLIAKYFYEVEYYRLHSTRLNSSSLKQQYILSKFKMDLLKSRLEYLRNLESSIKTVLNNKEEMQLIK